MAVLTRAIRHDAQLRRRQQNFLAAVSHEFKSPLASIQLAAETLVLRSREADSQRLGRRMLEDGERLLRMIDNLLDTTRLEEGRQKLAPQPTNVHAAATAAMPRSRNARGCATSPSRSRYPRTSRSPSTRTHSRQCCAICSIMPSRPASRATGTPWRVRARARRRRDDRRQRRRLRLSARGGGHDLREIPPRRRRVAPHDAGHRARPVHRETPRRAVGRHDRTRRAPARARAPRSRFAGRRPRNEDSGPTSWSSTTRRIWPPASRRTSRPRATAPTSRTTASRASSVCARNRSTSSCSTS